jgi:hypothetical protein
LFKDLDLEGDVRALGCGAWIGGFDDHHFALASARMAGSRVSAWMVGIIEIRELTKSSDTFMSSITIEPYPLRLMSGVDAGVQSLYVQ